MRTVLIRSAWVPPLLWGATLLYLRRFDGWEAWGAAPLLLPSLAASVLWGSAGAVLLARIAARERTLDVPLLLATLVGGFVLIYYVGRAAVG